MLRRTFVQGAAAVAAGTRPPWANDTYRGDDPVAAETDDPVRITLHQTAGLTDVAAPARFTPAFQAARYAGTAFTQHVSDLHVSVARTPVTIPDGRTWTGEAPADGNAHVLLTADSRLQGDGIAYGCLPRVAIVDDATPLLDAHAPPLHAPASDAPHETAVTVVHEVGHLLELDHRDGTYLRRQNGPDVITPLLTGYVERFAGTDLNDGTTVPEDPPDDYHLASFISEYARDALGRC